MTVKDIAFSLEDLKQRIWKIRGISTALSECPLSEGEYGGAVSQLADMSHEADLKADALMEEVFKLIE